ncbi:MAG: hypothetical protein M1827_007035 [Pycnora praestabilis]|nr:MAG: hypothetical protein M1827_007035 [Pycnora praestabilis]
MGAHVKKDIEILVHVSAPSAAKDDQRCRTQAAAYLDFDSIASHSILIARDPLGGDCGQLSAVARKWQNEEDQVLSVSQRRRAETRNRGASAQGNIADTGAFHTINVVPSGVTESTETTVSALSIPFLLNSAPLSLDSQIDRVHQIHALTNQLVQEPPELIVGTAYPFEQSGTSDRPVDAPGQRTNAKQVSHNGTQSLEIPWETPPSIISDSQKSDQRPTTRPQSMSSPSTRPAEPSSPAKTSQKRYRPSSSSQPTASHKQAQIEAYPLARISHSISPPPAADFIDNANPNSTASDHPSPSPSPPSPSFEIHPPPPLTSTTSFKTHITPTLETLASTLDISKRFHPQHTTRPLRLLERGHWFLDVSAWDFGVRSRFWAFLEDIIGDGRAGWGVWCVRDVGREHGEGHKDDVYGRADQAGEGSKGDEKERRFVRVYCWGEVVGHIYLLLFLASNRQIKGKGAVWIDGGGEVVVRMP